MTPRLLAPQAEDRRIFGVSPQGAEGFVVREEGDRFASHPSPAFIDSHAWWLQCRCVVCALHHIAAQGCCDMAESARTPTTRRGMSRCRGRRHRPPVYVDVLHGMCMCMYRNVAHPQWAVFVCTQAEAWGDEAAKHHIYRKATENSTVRFSHLVTCSDKQLDMLLRKDMPMHSYTPSMSDRIRMWCRCSQTMHHELCMCTARVAYQYTIQCV